uniref:Orf137a n=1 Tax=Batis maritima TaxID=4436 RepID=A0A068BBN4_BATMA|nr:orf137a [Batis maritima]AIC83340.1 orf137a [Batis maritima]
MKLEFLKDFKAFLLFRWSNRGGIGLRGAGISRGCLRDLKDLNPYTWARSLPNRHPRSRVPHVYALAFAYLLAPSKLVCTRWCNDPRTLRRTWWWIEPPIVSLPRRIKLRHCALKVIHFIHKEIAEPMDYFRNAKPKD